MRRRRKRFKLLEIPSSRGVVRIELQDGSVGIYDPEDESYYDGWATLLLMSLRPAGGANRHSSSRL